jgi:hypothetical protein
MARSLLEGSFHEMGHVAKVIDWKDIASLYELLNHAKTVNRLKSKLRLLQSFSGNPSVLLHRLK